MKRPLQFVSYHFLWVNWTQTDLLEWFLVKKIYFIDICEFRIDDHSDGILNFLGNQEVPPNCPKSDFGDKWTHQS